MKGGTYMHVTIPSAESIGNFGTVHKKIDEVFKIRGTKFNATDYAIKIFPGVRVAQIVFEELKEKPSSEKQYRNKVTAAYQHEKQFIGGVAAEDFNRIVSSAVEKLLKKGE